MGAVKAPPATAARHRADLANGRGRAHIGKEGMEGMAFSTRIRAVGVAVLFSALGAAAFAADVNVVGVWKGPMETQMGAMENVITIEAASPLTGAVKVGEYGGKIEKGTLDGEKIAFLVTTEMGQVAYEGVVAGDELKLTVVGPSGNKMDLIARRQK
jgi:hypothetical protein